NARPVGSHHALGPISSLSLCCRSNLVRPACRRFTPWQPRRRYARFFGKDYNRTIGHRLDAIGADAERTTRSHLNPVAAAVSAATQCTISPCYAGDSRPPQELGLSDEMTWRSTRAAVCAYVAAQ